MGKNSTVGEVGPGVVGKLTMDFEWVLALNSCAELPGLLLLSGSCFGVCTLILLLMNCVSMGNSLTSLCLSFFICEVGTKILESSH